MVNVSAPYATTGKPGVVHSACAKAGVEVLTKTLAAEWAGYNIRVNAVSPGPYQNQGARDRLWPSETREQSLPDEIPLGRFGRASEVAEIVCVLASRALPRVTGSVWVARAWGLPVAQGSAGGRSPESGAD
jgi:2,4-dienoyl-CoA reductase (NADPH2)